MKKSYGTHVRISKLSHKILTEEKKKTGSSLTFLLNNMIWLVWGKKGVKK